MGASYNASDYQEAVARMEIAKYEEDVANGIIDPDHCRDCGNEFSNLDQWCDRCWPSKIRD